MQTERFRRSLLAAAVGIVYLTGCQLPGRPPSGPSLSAGGEGASPITAAQAADVQIAFGRALEKQGDLERSAAAYREAVKRDPHRADACWRLAVLQDRQGKGEEAGELYRKALQAQPDNADLYCDLGYSLYLRGCGKESEANLRHALQLAADHRRAHNNLALLLAHTGRADEALAEFRKGGCKEADAHTDLAFALTLERRWDEAREHYELALAAAPSSEPARQGLRELNRLTAKLAAHAPAAGSGPPPSTPEPGKPAREVRQSGWSVTPSGAPAAPELEITSPSIDSSGGR
jgi:tetratricopeptide (TPR) repeat protein